MVLSSAEFEAALRQRTGTDIDVPDDIKVVSHAATLKALAGGIPLPFGYPVDRIISRQEPLLLSHAQMGIHNLIAAFDFIVNETRRSDSWQSIARQHLYRLALGIDPTRQEYDFVRENILIEQINRVWLGVATPCERLEQIFALWCNWHYHRNTLSWTIGLAIELAILAKIFCIAPSFLPDLDYAPLINSLRGDTYGRPNRISADFQAILQTIDLMTIKPTLACVQESDLLPLLRLLADGEPQSRKDLMSALGIKQRAEFADAWLAPALKKLLIVNTEQRLNSPKQKYRITEKGQQQLKLAGVQTSS